METPSRMGTPLWDHNESSSMNKISKETNENTDVEPQITGSMSGHERGTKKVSSGRGILTRELGEKMRNLPKFPAEIKNASLTHKKATVLSKPTKANLAKNEPDEVRHSQNQAKNSVLKRVGKLFAFGVKQSSSQKEASRPALSLTPLKEMHFEHDPTLDNLLENLVKELKNHEESDQKVTKAEEFLLSLSPEMRTQFIAYAFEKQGLNLVGSKADAFARESHSLETVLLRAIFKSMFSENTSPINQILKNLKRIGKDSDTMYQLLGNNYEAVVSKLGEKEANKLRKNLLSLTEQTLNLVMDYMKKNIDSDQQKACLKLLDVIRYTRHSNGKNEPEATQEAFHLLASCFFVNLVNGLIISKGIEQGSSVKNGALALTKMLQTVASQNTSEVKTKSLEWAQKEGAVAHMSPLVGQFIHILCGLKN